ncbi:MAG: DUF1801 domain-containing protein [Fimbriimonadaceae bacterium]|nr:DUF1801 domain-containing protein [Fimbriimonadaceae bacterium]
MADPTSPHDSYLASLPPAQRAALELLRQQIHAAAPGAVECLSYRLPAFRLNGKLLVAYGAAKRHCALYPLSGRTVATFAAELTAYSTSAGTIRFTPEQPLPADLLHRLVAARLAEG